MRANCNYPCAIVHPKRAGSLAAGCCESKLRPILFSYERLTINFMSFETILVPRHAGLDTIIHLVRQTTAPRVLLVLPRNMKNPVHEPVDMGRIKQVATDMNATLGVVSLSGGVREAARSVGLRAFATQVQAKLFFKNERPWWLPKQTRLGQQTVLSEADKAAMNRRMKPKPRWLTYGYRYVTIPLFVATLALLAVTAFYALPSATIVLKPEIRPIQIVQAIVADPRADEESAGGATVPGRLLLYTDKWRASVETTGRIEIPDQSARGLVTFVNRVPQAASIPAGTRVSTSTGERIVFQTLQSAELPARVGAEVDIEVVAVEPGSEGNVAGDRINRVEGALANQLNVRNLFALTGGANRVAPTVSPDDVTRLREHILEALHGQARANMQSQLNIEEFLAEDSVRIVAIYAESQSHFAGEETATLAMEIRAELHGTAVNENIALTLVNEQLAAAVPEGFEILDGTIQPRIGRLLGVDGQGRVSLEMIGEALVIADLQLQQPLSDITGQETEIATYYLNEQLLLRDLPEVHVWPERRDRIPYLPARIYTSINRDLEN